jgi:hypothetical protein
MKELLTYLLDHTQEQAARYFTQVKGWRLKNAACVYSRIHKAVKEKLIDSDPELAALYQQYKAKTQPKPKSGPKPPKKHK